jgi:hypothetical protein
MKYINKRAPIVSERVEREKQPEWYNLVQSGCFSLSTLSLTIGARLLIYFIK